MAHKKTEESLTCDVRDVVFEVDVHKLITVARLLQPAADRPQLLSQRGREFVAARPSAEVVQPGRVAELPAESSSRHGETGRWILEANAAAGVDQRQTPRVIVLVADLGTVAYIIIVGA